MQPSGTFLGAESPTDNGPPSQRLDRIPIDRAAFNEEVAGLIALLCSPAAAFMIGQSIDIDGGVVMW